MNKKTVVLGVTASIAAYKMADVASELTKQGYNVHVLMTKNATEIISPMVFSTLTGNNCIVDTFDKNIKYNVAHVSIAKQADLVMVAPATANIIGKLAHGIADDMLTTTIMACKCKKVIAPAMNTNMYENPVLQDNLEILNKYGWDIIEPASGLLACKDEGKGKLPKPKFLLECIYKEIKYKKDLIGKNVLVTAGPTMESLDPVRYLTNHSSGKMGYAIAKQCMQRGANVTLISGQTSLDKIPFVNTIDVKSTEEMFNAVKDNYKDKQIIFKAAAVSDYTPMIYVDNKIKKKDNDDMSIPLKRTQDILKWLGENKKADQYICGFSMETENMIENSRKKLIKKNIDLIVANNLKDEGAGFKTDTNIVTIITKEDYLQKPLLSKEEVAKELIDYIINQI